jgi:hypothetical protein
MSNKTNRKTVTRQPQTIQQPKKAKKAVPYQGSLKAEKETLEERRQRNEAVHDSIARAARLASRATEVKVPEVKVPVNLNTVYHAFLKRIGPSVIPVKVMKTEEQDPFGRTPRIIKIEARFMELAQNPVLQAMKGLDVRHKITKVRDMSYTHCALWGHKGSVIKFRVSMYRYRDKSVLFIFTPE